jgi:hypothetical protein
MPVTMMVMMVVVAMMVPAMPPMMVMVSPMNFRRRRPGIFLNRHGGAGIAERQGIGTFGWCREREQRADGSESQNFRELHEISPRGRASRLRRMARRNAARNLVPAT